MNNTFKITLISLVLMFIAIPVFAATLTLSPSSINVKPGQSFNVTVALDSQGAKGTTIKMELKFPSDLVQVKSFSFASNSSWIALAQSGYDLVDNTAGTLIKTAGYPGGVSAPITFGTVSFTAKKAGNGIISSGANTLVLDAGNVNIFSGMKQIAVTVAAPATLPAATTLAGAAVAPTFSPSPSESVTPTVSPSETVSPGPSSAPAGGQAMILGAIGNVITLGTGNNWLGLLVVIVLLAAIYYIVRKIRKPKIQQ